jgi:hypothetical protein
MKVRVTLKDPDGIYDCLQEAIADKELRTEVKYKFFEYGDYCEIEIDTEAMSAIVVPVR